MAVWDDVITERDKEVYRAAGYGERGGLGSRPALLVIDVTYSFTGDRPEPILDSIRRFRNSCGDSAWRAVSAIKQLLDAFRPLGVPVVYTKGRRRTLSQHSGRWLGKNSRAHEDLAEREGTANEIVAEIAPAPGEIIVEKEKPSAFFGTGLVGYLVLLGVDTLIVTGCTTSGCVRATVVDAFSYNYRVAVVQEATFDRGEVSHKVNLFDIHSKYGDVITLAEALGYARSLGRGGEPGCPTV